MQNGRGQDKAISEKAWFASNIDSRGANDISDGIWEEAIRLFGVDVTAGYLTFSNVWHVPKDVLAKLLQGSLDRVNEKVVVYAAENNVITWDRVSKEYFHLSPDILRKYGHKLNARLLSENQKQILSRDYVMQNIESLQITSALAHTTGLSEADLNKINLYFLFRSGQSNTADERIAFYTEARRNGAIVPDFSGQLSTDVEEKVLQFYRTPESKDPTKCKQFWRGLSRVVGNNTEFRMYAKDPYATEAALTNRKYKPDYVTKYLCGKDRAYIDWDTVSNHIMDIVKANPTKAINFVWKFRNQLDWNIVSERLNFGIGLRGISGQILNIFQEHINWNRLDYVRMRKGLIQRYADKVNWYVVKESGAIWDDNILVEHLQDIQIGEKRKNWDDCDSLKRVKDPIYYIVPESIAKKLNTNPEPEQTELVKKEGEQENTEIHLPALNDQAPDMPTPTAVRMTNKDKLTIRGACCAAFVMSGAAIAMLIGDTVMQMKKSSTETTAEAPALTGGEFDEINQLINKNSIYKPDPEAMAEGAYAGYVAGMTGQDPYAAYYTAEEAKVAADNFAHKYIGLGCTVSQTTEGLLIQEVYIGSGVMDAGLQTGDIITKIDGIDTTNMDMSLEDLVYNYAYGEEGSIVAIAYVRDGNLYTVDVTRKAVNIPVVQYTTFEDIGIINIANFDQSASLQFNNALEAVQAAGAKNLIIDLRDNPGGDYTTTINMLDRILPDDLTTYNANTVLDKNADQNKTLLAYIDDVNGTYKAQTAKDGQSVDLPIAVLVNGGSASASELFAGALESYGKATVIGETTYGKGVVQTKYPTKNGGYLQLTTGQYYLPNGTCVQGTGLIPTIIEENPDMQMGDAIAMLEGNLVEDTSESKAES